jgi:Zn-dependent protease
MLGWSINLFRIRGIQLALHGSFLLLLAYVTWEGWQGGGWVGAAWSIAILTAFFTCIVLHELGHCFTGMHFGIGVRRILLMPIGGMAEFESIPRQPSKELLMTLAGPAVNFIIAGVLFVGFGLPENASVWSFADYEASASGFAHLLLHWNLLMGCFNLAPVFPMDGGRILRALLATKLPYVRATFWAATVGKVCAVAAALVAAFWFQAYLTAFLFGFIFFAGETEYRAVQRREVEDAHWREMLARFHAAPPPEPPPDAPPLLESSR